MPHDWSLLVRAHLQRSGLDVRRFEDTIDEIALHLERVHRQALRDGCQAGEARASTLRELAGLDLWAFTRESTESRRRRVASSAWHSVRSGWRSVVHRAAASLGIITMLALGLGFNVALYAVVESALLRPLPYLDPERIAFIWQGLSPDGTGAVNSILDFEDLSARSRSFSAVAAYNISFGPLVEAGVPEQVHGSLVTPSFFQVLGRRALIGRTLEPGDELPTVDRPIVISHSLWTRRFGQDPAVTTRTLNLGGRSRRIVGVMPPDFEHPEPFWRELTEYWSPMVITPEMRSSRGQRYLRVIGRLATGVTWAGARAEVETIGNSLRDAYGGLVPEQNPVLRPVFEELVGDTRVWVLVCGAGAGLVLLLAIGNIVNLLLASTAARTRELAVRAALGAGRGRLVVQLLSESVLLSLCGGLVGLGLAALVLRGLLAAGTDLVRLDSVEIDGSVWTFSLALSLVTGLLCGLWPALRSPGPHVTSDLIAARGATHVGLSRARTWLIGGELALAVPLVVGALLLSLSLWNLTRVDPGFDGDRAVHFRLDLPSGAGQRYGSAERRVAFVRELESRLSALPGAQASGVITSLPLGGLNNRSADFLVDRPDAEARTFRAGFRSATPGYFEALSIPVLEGRLFTDTADDASVVVNQRFAEAAWPGVPAVGRRIRGSHDGAPWRTVIGVVGNVRHQRLTDAPLPEVFWPYHSDAAQTISVVVRGTSVAAMLNSVQTVVAGVDPLLPVTALARVSDIVAATRQPATLSAAAAAVFGGLALALSTFGTFAVLSLLVSQRSREIGIRFALGASRPQVGLLVLRDALVPAATGSLVGVVLASWLARAIATRVYGVDPLSPWILIAATGLLVTTAGIATWLPARRALQIDPAVTLRADA